MTDQVPDQLDNRYSSVNFDGLYLYSLIRGKDPSINHGWGDSFIKLEDIQALESVYRGRVTSIHSGGIKHFTLDQNGKLLLDSFNAFEGLASNFEPIWHKYPINHAIDGDFWAVFKATFMGSRTYVRFLEGKIADMAWVHEISGYRDDG
ncbi:hypothetical protein [Oceanicoccus sagamiensis]|uniref:Uncharacterized protein n=1 Tax=Oceanicoccus sagamiensis TaxID=716816 RepID=A0A1X9NEN5_9GAMM|nr:hypothetical protein [Oceanicoccus sagamiensis]ARN74009.1 hypothetical protein BST96_07680 [Oceanicoccus sagamiensis]